MKSNFNLTTGSGADGDDIRKVSKRQRPFGKINFIMMAVCVALIVIGFLLMSGGGSSVEGGFNPDIFSARRIVVGPLLAFLGFLFMAFAILWNPDRKSLKRGNNKHITTNDTEAPADKK